MGKIASFAVLGEGFTYKRRQYRCAARFARDGGLSVFEVVLLAGGSATAATSGLPNHQPIS
ncbi:MAG TPA: hypothetical protein VJM08_05710 [Anaerolineales bacterium]|nr:hypothetical protein [Anaerolineales bacterium]